MSKIVLCIDRDDDVGRKTGIEGPVVGREANLEAANSLALADPEDSDVNTIYQAIKVAEELDAEVATITGHPSVGMESDKHVSRQLDEVLEDFDEAVIVTDGAEDEFVLPLVESRVKVSSVRRVIVNQSQDLETTYYIVKRVLDDPRFVKKFFIPLGLASLAYALLSVAGLQMYGVSGILGVMGVYLINKATRFDRRLHEVYLDVTRSFLSGRVSVLSYFAGLVLFVVGGVRGYYSALDVSVPLTGAFWGEEIIFRAAGFLVVAVWWWVTGVAVVSIGLVLDRFLEKGVVDDRVVRLPFFAGSATLLLWGGSEYLLNPSFGGEEKLFFALGSSLLLGLLGIGASRSLKNAGWSIRTEAATEGHSE